MTFVLLTVGLQIGMYVLALGYSWAVIYGKIFKRHAIQPRDYRPDAFGRRIPLIALNAGLVVAFAGVSYYLLADYFVMGEFPLVWTFLVQLAIFFLLDDVWYYFMHRAMHQIPWLMNTVHKRHHTASKPFPLDYMYVNPVEWMMGMIGPVLGMTVILTVYGEVSAWTMWTIIVLRNVHEMQAHSGLKEGRWRSAVLIGTSDHHDLHHSKLNGNYGSLTRIWDLIFGTEIFERSKHQAAKRE